MVGDPFLAMKGSGGVVETDLDVVVNLLLPVLRPGSAGGQPQLVRGRQDLIQLAEGIGMIKSLDHDPGPIVKLMILEERRRMPVREGDACRQGDERQECVLHDSSVDNEAEMEGRLARMKNFEDPCGMTSSDLRILGVPMGIGGGKPGTAMAPWKVREMAIVERLRTTIDHLTVEDAGDVLSERPDERSRLERTADWCGRLRARTKELSKDGAIPLVIGGDHTLAAGSLSGVAATHFERDRRIPGVLWIDAHVDMNTHLTSPSGNPHGMSAAALLGLEVDHLSGIVGRDGRIPTDRIAFLGARDIDPGERSTSTNSDFRSSPLMRCIVSASKRPSNKH